MEWVIDQPLLNINENSFPQKQLRPYQKILELKAVNQSLKEAVEKYGDRPRIIRQLRDELDSLQKENERLKIELAKKTEANDTYD